MIDLLYDLLYFSVCIMINASFFLHSHYFPPNFIALPL